MYQLVKRSSSSHLFHSACNLQKSLVYSSHTHTPWVWDIIHGQINEPTFKRLYLDWRNKTMIAKTDSTGHEMARLAKWEEAITGIKFDSIVAALLVWLVGGLYLDGWAHHHEALDSFF